MSFIYLLSFLDIDRYLLSQNSQGMKAINKALGAGFSSFNSISKTQLHIEVLGVQRFQGFGILRKLDCWDCKSFEFSLMQVSFYTSMSAIAIKSEQSTHFWGWGEPDGGHVRRCDKGQIFSCNSSSIPMSMILLRELKVILVCVIEAKVILMQLGLIM